ncbi:putative bifunctional diguanylate cyclase/phosphodiesterase [Methyloterricola oryzae]|uniref:putative bifunctional diguanylate cyclase/phosphodiesterase n=1 Tax=Methyloterricola oryzae TaxID=1495050 RepID=UPI0005EB8401|nr:GGDEF domain-containing phosphodiesterase [Methyloterricola oryzae]
MGAFGNDLMKHNLDLLRSKARKEAVQGVFIAAAAIMLATLMVCFFEQREITLSGLIQAQRTNLALWILNAMAFVFPLWGQYASRMIVYEAGAMVRHQTEELRVRNDQLEREKAFASTHDPITELPNRPLFYDRVEQAIRSYREGSGNLTLFLLELENLKEIQDTIGPTAVDIILRQVATRLLQSMSAQDSVARLDGFTFGILCSESTGKEQAEHTAHRLQKVMEHHFDVQRLKLSLHTSIGIVLFPEHGEDADTLVQKAGVAVFMAGKSHDGFAFYSPSFDEHSPRRLTLMGELRQAIERNHLQLHYQPKAAIPGGKIIGAEALVRWNHPKHGFVAPDEFIGLAERTRMIKPLTQWVMERAFNDCAQLRGQGHEITVSINLSAKDLHDPQLPDRIVGAMSKTAVQPEWFIFEITESSIIADPDRVLNVLERINGLGFGLSIDDFGTGYSSLAYLSKLPVQELKIDRSFVRGMLLGSKDGVIVRATVQLAHNLNLKVTAEGVENEETLELLRQCQCDIAQGYYLGKPQPLEQLTDRLGQLAARSEVNTG